MDIYSETILEHYRHPQGKGTLASPTFTHEEVNPSCGDALTVHVRIENGRIAEVAWEGHGCAISQAGMSLLMEHVEGKTLQELEALPSSSMKELLGVTVGPRRVKCALLSLHALKNTLRTAQGQPPFLWAETLAGWEEESPNTDLI